MTRTTHRLSITSLLAALAVPSLALGQADKFPLLPPDQPQAQEQTPMMGRGLAIQAVQGTPGAAPVGAVPATIQLHNPQTGAVLETVQTTLDEHGVIMIESFELTQPFIPVAQIEYAGVTYSSAGEVMSPQGPGQKVTVQCYEVTEETTAWSVAARHLQAIPHPQGGLQVQEMLIMANPASKTWLGTQAGENRNTTAFAIPQNATDVQLGQGFHGWCCTEKTGNMIINHLPLMPGQSRLTIGYRVPSDSEGAARIAVSSPAPTQSVAVMLGGGLHAAQVDGLNAMEAGMGGMGSSDSEMYTQRNLAPGQGVSLLLASTGPSAEIAREAESQNLAKIVGIVGGALVLLIGVVFILVKSPKAGA